MIRKHRESLKAISPKNRNKPIEWLGFISYFKFQGEIFYSRLKIVAWGEVNEVKVHPCDLFLKILKQKPTGVILAHNHPSQEVIPSAQDLELTRKVKRACDALEIEFPGHWIVAKKTEYWIDLQKTNDDFFAASDEAYLEPSSSVH